MKKLTMVLLMVFLLTGVSSAFALQFNDIDNHWAVKQIYKMTAKKVVYGYSDGTFKPDKGVTHLEAVVMILRVLGLEEQTLSTYPSSMFADKIKKVPTWAKGYVTLAYEKGIIKQADLAKIINTTPATRQDVAVYLYRSFVTGKVAANTTAALKFTDLSAISQNAKEAVAAVVDQGIIKGNPDGTFKPAKGVSRAEIGAMLYIYDDKMKNEIDFDAVGTIDNKPDLATSSIGIKKEDGTLFSAQMNREVVIFRNNQKVDFTALKNGDKGVFVMDPSGSIMFMDLQGN